MTCNEKANRYIGIRSIKNHQLTTINHQPSTINHQPSTKIEVRS